MICLKRFLFVAVSIVFIHDVFAQAEVKNPSFPFWKVFGNTGTNPSLNYVGTTDNQDLTFRVNNVPKMRLFASNGRLELYGNSTDSSTIFIGRNTGSGSTSANGIFIGKDVGLVNSGNFNTMIGLRSGRANTTGFENTFIGYQTGRDNLSGRENTFLGSAAGQANTIGSTNVFVGNAAGASNLDGSSNTIVGSDAGSANVSGDVNVLIGNRSGRLVTVSNNTIVGGDAGFNTTTGGNNTFVGRSTGATNVTGGLNTMLGIDADLGFDNLTNATAIGARAQVDASNSLVLGSVNGVNGASSTVSVGIGVNAPLRTFHIGGLTSGFRYAGVATGGSFISTPSAVTDKLLFADANGDVRALNNGSNGQTLQIVAGAPQWSSGLVGPTGPTGAAGTNGTNGATGSQGPTGANGTNGANGATGPAGPTGAAGTNGANGATGPAGPTGAAGTNGANGATGPAGPTGAAGTNGTNGATGPQGPTGAAGTNGATGAAGATGPQGPIGPTGPAGSGGGTAWDLIGNTGTTASTSAIGTAVNNNFIGTTDSKDFVLATNNLERMRLLADGRFGVGTVAPATGVNAEFAYSGDFIFRLNTTTAGKVGLDFFRPGAGSFDWRIINDGGALNIFRGSNDFSIAPTDGYRFNSTNTAFHPTADNTKSLGLATLAWVSVHSYAFNTISDRREKNNIKPINYGLEEILKLRPVQYNWIKHPDEGVRIGLIAQELKTVLPEVVKDWEWKVDEKTGERTKVEAERMGVMYSDIIPVLIKAIQEQEANAQKSREEIELLKQELAKLKAGKQ